MIDTSILSDLIAKVMGEIAESGYGRVREAMIVVELDSTEASSEPSVFVPFCTDDRGWVIEKMLEKTLDIVEGVPSVDADDEDDGGEA